MDLNIAPTHYLNSSKILSFFELTQKSGLNYHKIILFCVRFWYFKVSEAVVRKCSLKKALLKITQNSNELTWGLPPNLQETPPLVFSCGFWKKIKNNYFVKHLSKDTSEFHEYFDNIRGR